jgi:hypothetical protein
MNRGFIAVLTMDQFGFDRVQKFPRANVSPLNANILMADII